MTPVSGRSWYHHNLLVTVSRDRRGRVRIHYTTSGGEITSESLKTLQHRVRQDGWVCDLAARVLAGAPKKG